MKSMKSSASPSCSTCAGLRADLRFSQLSAPRQALVRLCQTINYGSIHGLCVKDGEPVFSPPPVVLLDVRLDADDPPRPEVDLPDFELCSEVRRLMGKLRELTTGIIEQIEIRGGIARRIVLRGSLADARPYLLQSTPPDEPDSEGLRPQPNGALA